MPFDKEYMGKLLYELVAIPSVSKCAQQENACADLLAKRLREIAVQTQCQLDVNVVDIGDFLGRKAVLALLHCPKKTKKTVLLTGHFDVVGTAPCGDLADFAFDPERYTQELKKRELTETVRRDLDRGWIAARGIMDMKAGLALFVTAIRAWAQDGDLPVNIAFLAVPDEEADSDGMRGAVKPFVEMLQKEGLECVAALTGEPCFWNETKNPPTRGFYTGSTGKIMPLVVAQGVPAHIADYFSGVSAALMISLAVKRMEAAAELFEQGEGWRLTPAACLSMKVFRDEYSVTLPEQAGGYFNVLTVRTPAAVLETCLEIVRKSAQDVKEYLQSAAAAVGDAVSQSRTPEVSVITVAEVFAAAKKKMGAQFDRALKDKIAQSKKTDARDRSIDILLWCLNVSGILGPVYVVGFVPPYYPARINRRKTENERKLRAVMEEMVSEAGRKARDGAVELTELFTGISDLSFTGFDGKRADLQALADNMAGWGDVYDLPIESLLEIDIPVANMGPSGRDAHQATERLEPRYSFEIAPQLLMETVAKLA